MFRGDTLAGNDGAVTAREQYSAQPDAVTSTVLYTAYTVCTVSMRWELYLPEQRDTTFSENMMTV